MRISYCTWGMMKVDIEDVIPAVAEIGYQAIELAVSPRWPTELYSLDAAKKKRITQLLAEYNLALSAVAGHTSMCELDVEKNDANMQRLRDTIDLAAELRQTGEQPIVASLVGGREEDWEAKKELLAERVLKLGEYAASRDVILGIEPHCGTALYLPDKVLWLNYPSSIHLQDDAQVEQATVDLLNELPTTRGLIMGITEDMPPHRWRDSCRAIMRGLERHTHDHPHMY